jgi:hypothetical protein
MTTAHVFTLIALVLCFLGTVACALLAYMAYRAAGTARADQRATADMLRDMEVRMAVAAASAVQAEAVHAQRLAAELSRAYGLLGLFSSTFGNTDMQESQKMADSKADLAGEIATQAQEFVNSRSDLYVVPHQDIDRAAANFQKALNEVRALREDVEREQADVERQRMAFR